MTFHTFHEDPQTHGLADGCPRCAEHTADPALSLDSENLTTLVTRLHYGKQERSRNEQIALVSLDDLMLRIGRIVEAIGLGALGTVLQAKGYDVPAIEMNLLARLASEVANEEKN